MTAKGYLILPLAGVALVAAGCGSSSTHGSTKTASHGSMPMSHSGGPAGASMAGTAVAHAELVSATSRYGNVLYDKDHFVLYEYAPDHNSTSTCYGACSSAHGGWPPLLTKGAPRVAGLNSSLLGTTRRRDGSMQVTYGGHPLYYWSGDHSGDILCQHVLLHGATGTSSTPTAPRTRPRASEPWRRCRAEMPGVRSALARQAVHSPGINISDSI